MAIAVAAPADDSIRAKPIGFLSRDEQQDAFGQFSSRWKKKKNYSTVIKSAKQTLRLSSSVYYIFTEDLLQLVNNTMSNPTWLRDFGNLIPN